MIWIVLLLIVVFSYILGNILYKRTNAYKNRFVTIKDYKRGLHNGLKFASFGSTYAKYAFNGMKELGLNGFNFCLEAESLQSDLRLMHEYGDKLAPNCIVAINLAACVTCCEEEEVVVLYADNYYKLLKFKNLPKVLRINIKYIIHNLLPVRLCNIKQLGRLIFDVDLLKDITEREGYVSATSAYKNMENMAYGWIRMFHLKDLKSVEIPTEIEDRVNKNKSILYNLIDFCRQNQWCPVLVIPPAGKLLNDHFSDDFLNRVLWSVVDGCSKDKNVPVFNYLKDDEFQGDLNLYCDGGFRLNKYGSKKFMRRFLRDLTENGIDATNHNISDNERFQKN